MPLSNVFAKVVRAAAMMGVVVAAMFAVGSAATATTSCVDSQLPLGHYCGDGHPWHN
jgi:hypothetical protein